ncbi:hypothetical protein EUGRSUZ_D02154 [Eucalyptus grandis]|uniref:Uncharacterized protein n=2 Tax=Eucalyptus grandis TaxID=71139 RepID=A0ACC3L752_EUCGR|nr:hypothetical protein EUGRSUZ_D02154 [Eucalyptus grandis]
MEILSRSAHRKHIHINQVRQDRQTNSGCEMIELQRAFSRKKYGNPLLQYLELHSTGIAKHKNDHFFMQPDTEHTTQKRIVTYNQEQIPSKRSPLSGTYAGKGGVFTNGGESGFGG